MNSLFDNAYTFNQDLSSWDVSSVTNMSKMFRYAFIFNQDLSSWDVSSVTDMRRCFLMQIISIKTYQVGMFPMLLI